MWESRESIKNNVLFYCLLVGEELLESVHNELGGLSVSKPGCINGEFIIFVLMNPIFYFLNFFLRVFFNEELEGAVSGETLGAFGEIAWNDDRCI